MRRYLISTVVAALIASTTAALAAHKADGTVQSIDSSTMMLTLKDGQTFKLPSDWHNDMVKAGSKVTVTYEKREIGNLASAIVPQN